MIFMSSCLAEKCCTVMRCYIIFVTCLGVNVTRESDKNVMGKQHTHGKERAYSECIGLFLFLHLWTESRLRTKGPNTITHTHTHTHTPSQTRAHTRARTHIHTLTYIIVMTDVVSGLLLVLM